MNNNPTSPQPSPGNAIMVTAGFTLAELYMLIQGQRKITNECLEHTTALLKGQHLVDTETNLLVEYYGKRSANATNMLNRLIKLHEELLRKKNNSVAHNLNPST